MPRSPTAKTVTKTARPKQASQRAPNGSAGRPAAAGRGLAPRATPEALAALRAAAHPLRLRLLELFAQGARTTKQAAADLGEPPTRLYHHVHALERAGLVRLVETRAKRGTEEKYYELAPGVADDGHGGSGGRLRNALAHLDAGDAARAGTPLSALALTVLDATRADVAAALAGVAGRGGRERASDTPPLVARAVVPSAATAAALRAELLAVLQRHRARPETDAEARAQAAPLTHAARADASLGAPEAGAEAADASAWSLTVVLVPIRHARPMLGRARELDTGNPRRRR